VSSNFQQLLLGEVNLLLRPLAEAAESDVRRRQIFESIGWDLEAITDFPVAEFKSTLGQLVASYEQIGGWVEQPPTTLSELLDALRAIEQTVNRIRQLSKLMDKPDLVRPPEFDRLASDLIEHMTIDYLQTYHPFVHSLAELLTLIELAEEVSLSGAVVDPSTQQIVRFPRDRSKLRFDRLQQLLADPAKLLKQEYLGLHGLATIRDAKEAAQKLFPRLGRALGTLGIESSVGLELEHGVDFGPTGNELASLAYEIFVPLVPDPALQESGFGATLILSPADRGDLGLVVAPSGQLSFSDLFGSWLLNFKLRAGGPMFSIGPHGLTLPASAGDTRVDIQLDASKLPAIGQVAAIQVGSTTGTRLHIGEFRITAEANLDRVKQDYGFVTEVGSAAFVVSADEGDGFLKKVLPENGFQTNFDLAVGWSNRKSLYFRGSAGLEATLSVHKDLLGVLKVDSVYLGLRIKGNEDAAIQTVAAVTASVKLGPFAANVERIGLLAKLTFPPNGGNLGPFNLEFGFKPPDGAGIAIDASAVIGGGYLHFDPTNEQYAGILQLEIKGGISLKAIGLLTTRLPGLLPGTKGFSLLVIISAEFPAIQLGFGFSLTGVGGLLGVNRTMVLEALRSGVKDHSLDSILFPVDPVENAQRIISDLQGIFPPATGRFVFGPMAKLAWGKPATILTIELGIVLELPAPVRLAIMGRLHMALPSQDVEEDLQVVVLRMDVLGTIDFDKGEASIDAILYDSRVAKFAISGGMAMRLSWGASPNFALAVGGFNPRFQPPPNFPSLDRLAISLSTDDSLQLRLEAYFAQTPNTVQFGARLDLYAAKDVTVIKRFRISVEAYLGFDGLIQFPPLSFIVDIYGGAAIKVDGNPLFAIHIQVAFSGFTPLHAVGEATLDFLGVKARIPIDWTIGDPEPPPLPPPVDVLQELRNALADPRSWSAQLPSDGHMLVTLRQLAVKKDELLMHPSGELTVRQKVVPLDIAITKFGSGTPSTPGPFTISGIFLSGEPTESNRQMVRDPFAPGQFFNKSDDELLSQPAAELLLSGCTRIGTAAISQSKVLIPASFEYDSVVIDNKEELVARRGSGFEYEMPDAVLLAVAELGSAGQSTMRSTGSAKFAGSANQRVTFKGPEYVVASVDDMTWDPKLQKPSYAEAEAARQQKGSASKHYQVVGSHEVV
jgi:hypothetical protein